MKKIIFNGIGLTCNELYGIHRYNLELLKEIDKIIDDDNLIFVAIPKNPYTCERINFKNIKVVKVANINNKIQAFLWNQITFNRYARKHDFISIDLTLGTSFFPPDIFCIHDCIRELYKQNIHSFKGKISRLLYILQIRKIILKSKVLLTVSEYSKAEINKYYKNSKNKKIVVIYNSWQHYSKLISDYNVINRLKLTNKKFCFSLGSVNYHKNTKWIIAAAYNNKDKLFVISGVNKFYEDNTKLPKNLIFTGYLSDSEVKALMECCYVFIQPSLYEGFGIPPLEAMSVGAKCIVSNASALPEIYGNSVWYIDPLKYDNISIDEIMSKPIEDNSKVLEKYSWKKSAEKLLEVLKSL